MTRCPECDGDMEFDPKIRKYVCLECGVALSKTEIDDMWDDIRFKEDPQDKKKREQEEYRQWLFQKKSTRK